MTTEKTEKIESMAKAQMDKAVARALKTLVRALGLVNGTITIRARGGELCRGVEVVNNLDVLGFE